MRNYFEYIINTNTGEFEAKPLGEKGINLTYTRENSTYDKQLTGTLVFKGRAYNELMEIERDENRCSDLSISLYNRCNGIRKDVFHSKMDLNNSNFDLDRCEISSKFEKTNQYLCLEDSKDDEIDLFDIVQHDKVLHLVANEDTQSETIEFEKKLSKSNIPRYFYYQDKTNEAPEESVKEFFKKVPLDYLGQGYAVVASDLIIKRMRVGAFTDKTTHTMHYTLVRNQYILPSNMNPPFGFILKEDKTNENGTIVYYAPPQTYNERLQKIEQPLNSTESNRTWTTEYRADILTLVEDAEIDNGMLFNDVLKSVVYNTCGLDVRSDFFQINVPEDEQTNINYVTGTKNYLKEMILFQKSDAIRFETEYKNATKALLKVGDIWDWLKIIFNVEYAILDGVFRIEHVSYFDTKMKVIDLTQSRYRQYLHKKNKYHYTKEKKPKKERFIFENQKSYLWQINQIEYFDCNLKKDKEDEHKLSSITTDVFSALAQENKQGLGVGDLKGFVLFIAEEDRGTGRHINDDGNYRLSWANLIQSFHLHERPFNYGQVNGFTFDFLSTSKQIIQEQFSIPLCMCGDDVFNPHYKYKTELGIGTINKAEYDLTSNFVTIELIYPYNNFMNIGSRAKVPYISNEILTIVKPDKLVKKIDIDDKGIEIVNVEVIKSPENANVTIKKQGDDYMLEVTAIGNYTGQDMFEIQATNIEGTKSNVAVMNLVITAQSGTDGYPILTDDYFETQRPERNKEYLVGNILQNDNSNSNDGVLRVIEYEWAKPIRRRVQNEPEPTFRITESGDFYVTYTGEPTEIRVNYKAENSAGLYSWAVAKHRFKVKTRGNPRN